MSKNSQLIDLETNRLTLVGLVSEDKKLFYHLYTDPQLVQNMEGALDDRALEKAFNLSLKYNQASDFKRYTWVVRRKIDGEKIGICALVKDKLSSGNIDIGTILVRTFHQKGYATESLARLMEFGFNQLYANKIQGTSLAKNAESANLMRKLGFSSQSFRDSGEAYIYWSIGVNCWEEINLKNISGGQPIVR